MLLNSAVFTVSVHVLYADTAVFGACCLSLFLLFRANCFVDYEGTFYFVFVPYQFSICMPMFYIKLVPIYHRHNLIGLMNSFCICRALVIHGYC